MGWYGESVCVWLKLCPVYSVSIAYELYIVISSFGAAGQQLAYKSIIENKKNLVHKMFRAHLAFMECQLPFAAKDEDFTHRL